MAERIEWFDVTVPARTAKTAPVETALQFNSGVVERLELTIPDGHAGLTGIRFNSAHQQIIPLTSGLYVVGNGVEKSWDLHGYPDNGNWSVTCFNTDIYAHSFHIAFLVNEGFNGTNGPVKMIPTVALNSPGTVTPDAPPLTVDVVPGPAGG